MSSQGIGVEFHPQGIRMARVQTSSRGIHVQHVAETHFPEGSSLMALEAGALPKEVAAVFDPRQFSGREITVVVDDASVVLSMFGLAAGFTDGLGQSINWYAEQYLPYPIRQARVDFRVEDSPYGGQKTVFLVALQKAVIEKIMALLPPKRMKLRRIDVVPYALYRLYRTVAARGGDAVEPAVVVHAARSGAATRSGAASSPSAYALVTAADRIEVVRHMRLGEEPATSLARKVDQVCHYYEVHHPADSVQAVWATLQTLAIDGAREALAEALGLEVQALDLGALATFAGGKTAADSVENWQEKYSLAVGAAL